MEVTAGHGRQAPVTQDVLWSPQESSVLIFLLPPQGLKQLRWEAERDDWLHNRDVKSIVKRKKNFRKKPKTTQKIKNKENECFLNKLQSKIPLTLIFIAQPFS